MIHQSSKVAILRRLAYASLLLSFFSKASFGLSKKSMTVKRAKA